ncbi:MAG: thioredoxin family protein [Arcobacter sp.]|uniref:thioredoxin family protein n=1 Tax=Arcobacter sp. TaxID=1872629 RepID=UPI003CFE585F
MFEITNSEQIKDAINQNQVSLFYFSGENCSVCKVLKPKIEEEITKNFPKIKLYEIKTDIYKELTSQFTVFSIPTTIIFFEGKEFKRYGRTMSIPLFLEEIKRPYDLMGE